MFLLLLILNDENRRSHRIFLCLGFIANQFFSTLQGSFLVVAGYRSYFNHRYSCEFFRESQEKLGNNKCFFRRILFGYFFRKFFRFLDLDSVDNGPFYQVCFKEICSNSNFQGNLKNER